MKSYKFYRPRRRLPRRLLVVLALVLALGIGGMIVVRRSYFVNLRPVSSSAQRQYVTIKIDSHVDEIASQLYDAKLIRSPQAFEWYVSVHGYREKLQAGTYSFAPNMGTSRIAEAIATGKVASDLVTILPGQRLDQIRQAFIKSGFAPAAVDAALQVEQYRGYPALADNPGSASLEGFLYPDSYQKTADTDPKEIVGESLSEMQKHLTTDVRKGFAKQGLTVYQGVILASIVEQEVSKQTDRNQAAQVFLKRLHSDMALGSDVTAYYGAIKAGVTPALDYDSPYNTLLHKGLPPGPISAVSDSTLAAVAHPAATDWLYFVAGDDNTTYFSRTLEEHNANIDKHCHTLCNETH